MQSRVWPLLLVWLTMTGRPALADPDLVDFGIGGSGILAQKARPAVDFRLEYRAGYSLVPYFEQYFKIKPWAGMEPTSRGAFWGGGGIWLDVPIGRHGVLSPSFGVGGYSRGSGPDLGSALEVRSTIEAGYVFEGGIRLTAGLTHMSNAGVSRHNPGLETAVVSMQIPIASLFHDW